MRNSPITVRRPFQIFAVMGILGLLACSSNSDQTNEPSSMNQSQMKPSPAPAGEAMHAVAVLHPTAGSSVQGAVQFEQEGDSMKVTADLQGLTPGQHGIHVHEYGDCSAPDGTSAGGHYNPAGVPHALPPAEPRHAGDFGNIEADASGNAHLEITVHNASVDGIHPVLGHAVIVHANADDGGQPTGNAGGRVACGVIGVAKPAAPMH